MTSSPNQEPCRLCSATASTIVLSQVSAAGGQWDLTRCTSCSFVTVQPLPDQHTLAEIYSGMYWRGPVKDALADAFYDLRMTGFAKRLKKLLLPGARVLDVGAGAGAWVRLLRRHRLDAVGIDPYAREQTNLVLNCDLDSAGFPAGSFAAVCLLNVLEHLADPLGSLRHAAKYLRPGGLLIVDVPNIASLSFLLFKRRWDPLDIPVHLNHFSPASLETAVQNSANFELVFRSTFSLRDGPAALAKSLFPALQPRLMRLRHAGRYPLPHKLVYLTTQLLCLPPSWLFALAGRGDVIRAIYRKQNGVAGGGHAAL